MLKLFKRQTATEDSPYFLILDLGSFTLKSYLVKKYGEKIILLKILRRKHGLGNFTDSHSSISAFQALLYTTLKEAESKLPVALAGVLVNLEGTLECRVSRFSFERPQPEDGLELHELKEMVFTGEQKIWKKMLKAEDESILINADLVNCAVDGVNFKNPLGQTGKELGFTFFNVWVKKTDYNRIAEILSVFGRANLFLITQPYAFWSILNLTTKQNDLILVTVGHAKTTVSIFKAEQIQGEFVFNLGGKDFTQALLKKFNLRDKEEAEKLKLAYSAKNLPVEEDQKVKQAFKPLYEFWLTGLEESLRASGQVEFPGRFVLLGGGSSLADLKKAVEEYAWEKKLNFKEKISAYNLTTKDLDYLLNETGEGLGGSDLPALLTASVILKLEQEDLLTNLLKQAIVLMRR